MQSYVHKGLFCISLLEKYFNYIFESCKTFLYAMYRNALSLLRTMVSYFVCTYLCHSPNMHLFMCCAYSIHFMLPFVWHIFSIPSHGCYQFINSGKRFSEQHLFFGNSWPLWSGAVKFCANPSIVGLLMTLLLCAYGMIYSGFFGEG